MRTIRVNKRTTKKNTAPKHKLQKKSKLKRNFIGGTNSTQPLPELTEEQFQRYVNAIDNILEKTEEQLFKDCNEDDNDIRVLFPGKIDCETSILKMLSRVSITKSIFEKIINENKNKVSLQIPEGLIETINSQSCDNLVVKPEHLNYLNTICDMYVERFNKNKHQFLSVLEERANTLELNEEEKNDTDKLITKMIEGTESGELFGIILRYYFGITPYPNESIETQKFKCSRANHIYKLLKLVDLNKDNDNKNIIVLIPLLTTKLIEKITEFLNGKPIQTGSSRHNNNKKEEGLVESITGTPYGFTAWYYSNLLEGPIAKKYSLLGWQYERADKLEKAMRIGIFSLCCVGYIIAGTIASVAAPFTILSDVIVFTSIFTYKTLKTAVLSPYYIYKGVSKLSSYLENKMKKRARRKEEKEREAREKEESRGAKTEKNKNNSDYIDINP